MLDRYYFLAVSALFYTDSLATWSAPANWEYISNFDLDAGCNDCSQQTLDDLDFEHQTLEFYAKFVNQFHALLILIERHDQTRINR